ncbi:sugar ABC transporter permease [Aureimonas sp. Leaf454]|uniref:carbohydrate ABC transporter permease n=1 Tax=Aureimonas sp. Leaf454 TaxID=1736381 RepID=UPI0007014943|nr:sugar ABC transporter permease [Aureimonas sp. Leaf454]KQT54113.1 sugar ABC transporter permease [Aureimonas sp. Leaf454]
MATEQSKTMGRLAVAPSVGILFLWMIVPLAMTLWFSARRYNLNYPDREAFVGFANYLRFFSNPAFLGALQNTLVLVGSVLIITVVFGTLLALMLDKPIFGQGIVRLLVIAPFFVMPTVAALVWKNLMMDPINGFLAFLSKSAGLDPIVWFNQHSLLGIVIIVAWQWLPFATLIIFTALQSLDLEQKEAAEMDGAGALSYFWWIVLPHLARPITVVIMIETIFLLSVFAEIRVTTNGGPDTTNLPFLIYQEALGNQNIGLASAGGIIAVILANIVASFLVRIVGKNLDA